MNDHTSAVYASLVRAAIEFADLYKKAPVELHSALQDLYNREIGSHDLKTPEEVSSQVLSLQNAILQLCQNGVVMACQK